MIHDKIIFEHPTGTRIKLETEPFKINTYPYESYKWKLKVNAKDSSYWKTINEWSKRIKKAHMKGFKEACDALDHVTITKINN